ncbi:MAG: acetyl-CoA carboxylase biotin carboxyl carrier protein [Candidatus Limnocylindria bacterium]
MPEQGPPDARRPHRSAVERAADHAAIDRLTTELLPALIAKLGATGLGELEVQEGPWRVRLRRPAGARPAASSPGPGRERSGRSTDRADRPDRGERAERPERGEHGGERPRTDDGHVTATSPAVGVYRPRTDLNAGDRVQAGDALGAVEMLGIPQEIVAPADGVLGASLVDAGDAVEYGQALLVIERIGSASALASLESSTNGTGA